MILLFVLCPLLSPAVTEQTPGGQRLQAWQNGFPQLRETVRRGNRFYSIALLLCGQNSVKFMNLSWTVATPCLKVKRPCVLFLKDFLFVTLSPNPISFIAVTLVRPA